VDHVSVGDHRFLGGVGAGREGVLHPLIVQTVWEVVTSVGTARLLAVLRCVHRHLGLDHQVLKLHSLDEVGVPDLAAVLDANVRQLEGVFVKSLAADFEIVLTAEDGRVLLHRLLHFNANFSGRLTASGVAELIKLCN